MELGKKNNNRDSLLPLIILHIRQTDIRDPLHRADDSCKHVEAVVSEVDYAYACAPDCCCWPSLARVVFSSSGVRAAQLHRVCEFSALWVSATHPTHHPSTRASRPDHQRRAIKPPNAQLLRMPMPVDSPTTPPPPV